MPKKLSGIWIESATADFVNEIIKGNIVLNKVDAENHDVFLPGATYMIYIDENENETYEADIDTEYKTLVDNNGVYSLSDVPYGKYLIKEIKAPEGYITNENYYPVFVNKNGADFNVSNTDGEDIFVEQAIKGSVQITKVDEDYPDVKLSGAEFTVYAADKTTVIGRLAEIEKGVYRMDGLRYGKYYLKETKAPDYFILDENFYYFEIVNNGEVVVISNDETGKGTFINSPQTGELKIVKTSYDGKVEGFSFKVTGTEYATGNTFEQIYTTDKNGEIHITGLRPGEYIVSEVENEMSAGYTLPMDETLIIEYEKTALVEMYNSEIPDNPNTGDTIGSDGTMQSLIFVSAAVLLTGSMIIFLPMLKRRRRNLK